MKNSELDKLIKNNQEVILDKIRGNVKNRILYHYLSRDKSGEFIHKEEDITKLFDITNEELREMASKGFRSTEFVSIGSCDICGFSDLQVSHLTRYDLIEYPKEELKYKCNRCQHTNDLDIVCTCEVCSNKDLWDSWVDYKNDLMEVIFSHKGDSTFNLKPHLASILKLVELDAENKYSVENLNYLISNRLINVNAIDHYAIYRTKLKTLGVDRLSEYKFYESLGVFDKTVYGQIVDNLILLNKTNYGGYNLLTIERDMVIDLIIAMANDKYLNIEYDDITDAISSSIYKALKIMGLEKCFAVIRNCIHNSYNWAMDRGLGYAAASNILKKNIRELPDRYLNEGWSLPEKGLSIDDIREMFSVNITESEERLYEIAKILTSDSLDSTKVIAINHIIDSYKCYCELKQR